MDISSVVLQERIRVARTRTDALFHLLSQDELYSRPVAERHRLVFYMGHLEAFDWNLLWRNTLQREPFHAEFDQLFAFGIDPEIGQAPSDQPADWPGLSEIRNYCDQVRTRIDSILAQAPSQRVHVAIEHRLMHAETFAYLLNRRDADRKVVAYEGGALPELQFVEIPAGTATLGQADGAFGWDNEFSRHEVCVPAFAVSKYKVTNGDYLKFVEAGAEPPAFWSRIDGRWHYRGMFEWVALPLDWPVYVTWDEAAAYAKWVGKDLMTEPQFHRAAFGSDSGEVRDLPLQPGNFDFERWDPCPVTADPGSESPYGVAQLIGNGWEWTSTVFAPFAGFAPFSFYPGYSANFFDNAHYVMKGASPRTDACFARPSFRNWFRPNYPHVYACFRLVEN
jgi:formylglycine-generating enzyme required for sulfatase activity